MVYFTTAWERHPQTTRHHQALTAPQLKITWLIHACSRKGGFSCLDVRAQCVAGTSGSLQGKTNLCQDEGAVTRSGPHSIFMGGKIDLPQEQGSEQTFYPTKTENKLPSAHHLRTLTAQMGPP